MSAFRVTLPGGATTWRWACDECGQTSLCTFPDHTATCKGLRIHLDHNCRPVAA